MEALQKKALVEAEMATFLAKMDEDLHQPDTMKQLRAGTRIRRLEASQALAAAKGCFTPTHHPIQPVALTHSVSFSHSVSPSFPKKSTTGLSDGDLLLGLDVDTK